MTGARQRRGAPAELPVAARRILACALLVLILGRRPQADTIELTDGRTLVGVTVQEELLLEVRYELAGERQAVPSALVHELTFEKLPDALDEARSARAEGDLHGALALLEAFVAEEPARGAARPPWATAFAAWQAIEVRRELADGAGGIASARAFLERFPESRHGPQAYLVQAELERRGGDLASAEATLLALEDLARAAGLQRWELAARLARLASSERPGEEKRKLLRNLAGSATEYPAVRSEARTAEAESLLADAAQVAPERAAELCAAAERLFQQVVEEPYAGARALAAAHTGLAECLLRSGEASRAEEPLRQALLHALRVAVSWRQESEYLPHALFLAARAFELLGEPARAAEMRAELERLFPASRWAIEAREGR